MGGVNGGGGEGVIFVVVVVVIVKQLWLASSISEASQYRGGLILD